MNALLTFVIKMLPGGLAKLLIGLAGPTIRSLKLDGGEVQTLLGYVAQLYLGATPAYADKGAYLAADWQDIAESIHELAVATLAQYKVALADADVATLATALGTRIAVRYPPPVV